MWRNPTRASCQGASESLKAVPRLLWSAGQEKTNICMMFLEIFVAFLYLYFCKDKKMYYSILEV